MEEKEQAYILAEGGKAYGKPNGNNFDRGKPCHCSADRSCEKQGGIYH